MKCHFPFSLPWGSAGQRRTRLLQISFSSVFPSPPPPVNLPAGKPRLCACKLNLPQTPLPSDLFPLRGLFPSCDKCVLCPPAGRPLRSVSGLWDSSCPWESPEHFGNYGYLGIIPPGADFIGLGGGHNDGAKCQPHIYRLRMRNGLTAQGSDGGDSHALPFITLCVLLGLEEPGSPLTI